MNLNSTSTGMQQETKPSAQKTKKKQAVRVAGATKMKTTRKRKTSTQVVPLWTGDGGAPVSTSESTALVATKVNVAPEEIKAPTAAPSTWPFRRSAARNDAGNFSKTGVSLDVTDETPDSPASKAPLTAVWTRLVSFLKTQRVPKRLRVCESVSLGEKRFLAIVKVDSQSFLLGGSTGSVAMLAKLGDSATFPDVLQGKCGEVGLSQ